MERPLVSFVVLCYNQESFIREAFNSALLQTYSPLEIIVSDDCSTDGTFDVVQQMANDRGAYESSTTCHYNCFALEPPFHDTLLAIEL